MVMPNTIPTAAAIYDTIMRAAERQLATTGEARDIIAAGLEAKLRALVAQIAGNAANPIEAMCEDLASGS